MQFKFPQIAKTCNRDEDRAKCKSTILIIPHQCKMSRNCVCVTHSFNMDTREQNAIFDFHQKTTKLQKP